MGEKPCFYCHATRHAARYMGMKTNGFNESKIKRQPKGTAINGVKRGGEFAAQQRGEMPPSMSDVEQDPYAEFMHMTALEREYQLYAPDVTADNVHAAWAAADNWAKIDSGELFAAHPLASPEILHEIATDGPYWHAQVAAENHNMSTATLQMLADKFERTEDNSDEKRAAVAAAKVLAARGIISFRLYREQYGEYADQLKEKELIYQKKSDEYWESSDRTAQEIREKIDGLFEVHGVRGVDPTAAMNPNAPRDVVLRVLKDVQLAPQSLYGSPRITYDEAVELYDARAGGREVVRDRLLMCRSDVPKEKLYRALKSSNIFDVAHVIVSPSVPGRVRTDILADMSHGEIAAIAACTTSRNRTLQGDDLRIFRDAMGDSENPSIYGLLAQLPNTPRDIFIEMAVSSAKENTTLFLQGIEQRSDLSDTDLETIRTQSLEENIRSAALKALAARRKAQLIEKHNWYVG